MNWHSYLNSLPVEDKNPFILRSKYNGRWRPGDARIEDTNNYGVTLCSQNILASEL